MIVFNRRRGGIRRGTAHKTAAPAPGTNADFAIGGNPAHAGAERTEVVGRIQAADHVKAHSQADRTHGRRARIGQIRAGAQAGITDDFFRAARRRGAWRPGLEAFFINIHFWSFSAKGEGMMFSAPASRARCIH